MVLPVPASAVVGDLLLAFVVAAGGGSTITTPAGGWVRLASLQSGNQTAAVFGHAVAAGDPATVSVTVTAQGSGVICDYGAQSVPSLPSATASNVGATQAPAIATWQPSQVVAEFWATNDNVALAVTVNVNSPTVRASLQTAAQGSFLVADYRQTNPTLATTGDTVGTVPGVDSIIAETIGVGA